ncbi:monooxygenase [Mycolicibacterium insubricum]|uniref:nitric oxide dioxygenase n=1 Tax=Mycolicibacterium insubricum TaxID=444597 RepID=A0A1X0DJ46_9MYCO|nr:FAD-binding oxidoreductase [Mycolicibacterium insubricum]MCV7080837.1 2-polyprenylphenol hydroxylase [Mycolicibacterium insubricum]ORA71840.1 2-polyprenylphenol hydroxylase [Mycolicibacterium insubricum]BBZ65526.1 monooxygenase [Mycolicibacterium insubricum]
MGLEDRTSLTLLRAALTGRDSDDLIGRIFTCWFALDPEVRDLFPPDMTAQREVFGRVLGWLFDEFVAQRAEAPVAFLAQLGRDHRKYVATQQHYETMSHAIYATLAAELGDRFTPAVDDAAREAINLIAGVMSGAADADAGPAWWEGTVVETARVSRDLAVVRLMLDRPMNYLSGQYVNVSVPQVARRWRYLSPAIPANPEGRIEFHVRAVSGGMVSNAIVDETRAGDRWRLSNPHGSLEVDPEGGDVLMVAGSTGLAPLRAIIMDMCRYGENPRVHLFFGARYPCELYDLQTLWELAAQNPWLSVTPVSMFASDPPWAADYPDPTPPRGLHVRQTGLLPEVVTSYGGWGDRQILIAGNHAMIAATRAALIDKGAPPQQIQCDPV